MSKPLTFELVFAAKASQRHTVTIELSGEDNQTRTNNATEEAPKYSEKIQGMMLTALKQFLVANSRQSNSRRIPYSNALFAG